MVNNHDQLESDLKELEQEHMELNEIIDEPNYQTKFSQFTKQKLKKRKLWVKDRIKLIKSFLSPDIIA